MTQVFSRLKKYALANLRSHSFDGWLLKPIDFKKVEVLLQGVKNPTLRRDLLYVPGKWEQGGWLMP